MRAVAGITLVAAAGLAAAVRGGGPVVAQATQAPRNVVFILSDDHRYDLMGFHPNAPEWLETPALDRMAAEGVHIENASDYLP